jgi:hypothetical protein
MHLEVDEPGRSLARGLGRLEGTMEERGPREMSPASLAKLALDNPAAADT